MRLYIHTVGRCATQYTWDHLPSKWRDQAVLVVQAKEHAAGLYEAHQGKVLVLPKTITTLSPTRQWIMEQHNVQRHGPTLCLLDDDLREFAKRRTDNPQLFTQCTPAQRSLIFDRLERLVTTRYAHAGVLAREGGNRVEQLPFLYATRMMRVLAYHVPTVRAVRARFDRVVCKQDFDMTLQLLRAGHPNVVISDYVQGQAQGSGAVGGCAAYRTLAVMDAAARKLRELHPDFVKVVRKVTATAWGGAERTEVVVQWQRALKSSGYTVSKPRQLAAGRY